jgi:hypothetical protein
LAAVENNGKITMKRPLVAVVSCYVIGLLLGETSQPPLVALFSFSLGLLALALLLPRIRSFLIWPLLALAGWTNLVCTPPLFHQPTSGAVTIIARPGRWILQTMDGQKFSSAALSN